MAKLTDHLRLGSEAEAAVTEGQPLRGGTVDRPLKVVPGLAAIVAVLRARPLWARDRPLETEDAIYLLGWEEMRQDHVVKRGQPHVPWSDSLLAQGIENFLIQGVPIVPKGDSGEPVRPSLDADAKLAEKNRVDLWRIPRRPRDERI